MGGWIQYSMGQTVSAWLANILPALEIFDGQRFSGKTGLSMAQDVALFLDKISVKTSDGHRN